MDSSLCLYKGKLKEALTLVPTMSRDKKCEAVAYWNDVAGQLHEIVNESNSDYDQTLMCQANSHVRVDHHSTPLYSNSIIESRNSNNSNSAHCDNNVAVGLSTNSVADSNMVTSTLKQSATIQPFLPDDLIDKTIFDGAFLVESPAPTMEDCKNLISNLLLNDKMDPEAVNTQTAALSPSYAVAQPNLDCPNGSTSCTSNQTNDSNAPFVHVLKRPDMFATQVPSRQINTSKSIASLNVGIAMKCESYCQTIEGPQLTTQNHPISYVPTDQANLTPATISNKLNPNQNGSTNGIEYSNTIITNSLGCPRTATNMTDEIGNGQFDRGPKIFDEIDHYNQFKSNAQTIILSPSTEASTFIPTRSELFTQSDRPLQQIQLFSPNTSDYFNQSSYSLINGGKIKYLLCNICHEQFECSGDLNRHEQHVHSCQSEKEVLSSKLISGDIGVNGEPLGRLTEVRRETAVTSSPEGERAVMINNISGNQHTCEVCGKSGFSTKGNLKRHLRAHSGEKPFKCEYCESCFTEKKSLKIHVRRHTGEKPYKCEICGKLFSQTGVLQSHMALHLNERKFDCQKCGKAFRQRSQLKLHLMRHDGVKRLECSTCMAKFLTKGDLERHCRIHTGERPYACEICSKTFTRQQSLNEHMNRHTGRKPYDCKYCDKTFSEMSACYKHAKTHKRQEQSQQQSQSYQLQ